MQMRKDLRGALIWIVLGGAIFAGAWSMDRLERFNVKPYEAPGLVPALLGIVVALLGAVLLVRTVVGQRASGFSGRELAAPAASAGGEPASAAAGDSNADPAMSGRGAIVTGLLLSMVYALLLVGRGLPFWAATFGYVSAFIVLLDGARQRELGRSTGAILGRAALFGVAVSLVISLVFERVFLVRLP